MPELTVGNGGSVHYFDNGAGPPVLLIHGWLMSRMIWSSQEELAVELRLLTIDLSGHGDSAAADFSYDRCLDDIINLLDSLALERVMVVGWSMGSQIALRLYERAPDRLRGMILVAATPCFCRNDRYEHGLSPAETRNMLLRLQRDYRRTAAEFCRLMFSPGEQVDPESIVSSVLAELPDPAVAASALRVLASHDLRKLLPRVNLPVLLVHGRDDRICPAGAASFMEAAMPSATAVFFEGVGHAPFLSAASKFNSLVREFAKGLDVSNRQQ